MDDDRSMVGGVPAPAPGLPGGFGFNSSAIQSPYLNFDPNIISPNNNPSAAEWISMDGAINKPTRGRFEMAFSQIGGSVFAGAALGGTSGIVNGLRATNQLQLAGGQAMPSAIRRTQLLNYVIKSSSNMANAFGVVAVLYSAIGVGLSFVSESNDDLNSFVAGATTGALYGGISSPRPKGDATMIAKLKPMQRVTRSAVGCGVGMALTAVYLLMFNKEKYIKY